MTRDRNKEVVVGVDQPAIYLDTACVVSFYITCGYMPRAYGGACSQNCLTLVLMDVMSLLELELRDKCL